MLQERAFFTYLGEVIFEACGTKKGTFINMRAYILPMWHCMTRLLLYPGQGHGRLYDSFVYILTKRTNYVFSRKYLWVEIGLVRLSAGVDRIR